MQTVPLLLPAQVACFEELSSRKRVFEKLAELLTQQQPTLGIEEVLEALTNREKLGSTTWEWHCHSSCLFKYSNALNGFSCFGTRR